MRSLRNILVVLLAVAWLPMTMHCRLESLPGLEFLTCQSDCGSESEQGSDCDDGGCCAVEKSPYKTSQHRLTPPLPNILPLSFASLLDLEKASSSEAGRETSTVAPPELPRCWQFVFRTAAPPRAPSLAS